MVTTRGKYCVGVSTVCEWANACTMSVCVLGGYIGVSFSLYLPLSSDQEARWGLNCPACSTSFCVQDASRPFLVSGVFI